MTASNPTGRIVLLGATGYTGALTARALLGHGRRPLLAARSADKLAALAAELAPATSEAATAEAATAEAATLETATLETAVVDVTDAAAVARLVGPGDVLVTTVGPFARFGRSALDAAVGAGAAYLDSTGEPGFIREVFERYAAPARESGAVLLPAFGYDYVPGNLAGGLAVASARSAVTKVEIGYFLDAASSRALGSGMSSGTAATLLLGMGDPGYAYRGGALVSEVMGRRHLAFPVGGSRRGAVGVGSTEALSLPRVYPHLRDVGAYLGWFGPASRVLQGLSYVLPAPGSEGRVAQASARGRAKLAQRFLDNTGRGPDATARAKVGTRVAALAYDRTGKVVGRAELAGGNPYAFTAEILAWAAARAADGKIGGPGVLGPLEAFSLADLLDGVRAAGLRQVG